MAVWDNIPMASASWRNFLQSSVKKAPFMEAESIGTGPPAGLEKVMSYPAFLKEKYGVANSSNHNPVGPPFKCEADVDRNRTFSDTKGASRF